MAEVFPFVVGCARSGTTMLRAMLDSHPLIAVPHESYFAVPALRARSTYERAGVDRSGVDRGRLLDDLARDETFTRWDLPDAAVDAVRADATLRTVPDVLLALYRSYAEAAGKPRFADKTPRNVLHIQLLADSFPDARFVHLVRDGRDVVPSLVGLPYFPDRYAEAVIYWRDRVSQGRRVGRALDAERYHEVRYEELVADPEPTLRRLCKFLDVAYDDAMLGYHERADEVVAAVTELGHHQGIWQPPTPGMRSWRATMSAHDQELFEELAGSTLDQFGYDRSGRTPSVTARLEGWAWRGRLQLRARARRARNRVEGAWASVSG